MSFTSLYRTLWLQPVMFFLICLLCAFLSGPAAAAEAESAISCSPTDITLAPALRTLLFNQVAILPFQADDPYLAATLSESFYAALAKTKKYKLLPQSAVADQLKKGKKNNQDNSRQEDAIEVGRSLKARGVIHATVLPHWKGSLKHRKAITSLTINIQMTDAETGKTAWHLRVTCKGVQPDRQLNKKQADRIMDNCLQELIQAMIAQGDIFSPMLPTPTVISTRGELRKVRVILQPDPPYTFAAYQLLSAEDPEGVFTSHALPVKNDHAPIILEDTGLQDGKSYSYTVIGLTEAGLANIPAPPFSVTTSGAPKPLDALQASGNNLRYIRLLWAPSQDPNVTGYTIYRSTLPDGPFEKIADINKRKQQNYTDYGSGRHNNYGSLADDTIYYYTIRTKNRIDIESKDSPVASARTKGAPLPPTEVQAIENQPGKIPLFWAPGEDPDIKGYAVFRSDNGQEPFQQIDFVRGRESQEYTDTGSWNTTLKNNSTYFYRLRSINVLDISSPDSETVSATTKPAPGVVQGIRTSHNLYRKVNLQWQANPENDIISYEIFRGETGDDLHKIATVTAPATSYQDSGLRDGSTYWYQVRAMDNDQLKGDFFSPVTATTKPRPTAPAGLSIRLDRQGIMLQWQKNREKDIDLYEIFSMGFLATKVGETRGTSFLYDDQLEPGNVYRFQIRAINKDGMIGNYSQPLSIRIPIPVTPEKS
jgi:fibronectin type 3 domain-containing protein